MLNATEHTGGSVIVPQVTNSHVPQDFTVSRLLSTPTHSLGKHLVLSSQLRSVRRTLRERQAFPNNPGV